MRVGPGFVFFR